MKKTSLILLIAAFMHPAFADQPSTSPAKKSAKKASPKPAPAPSPPPAPSTVHTYMPKDDDFGVGALVGTMGAIVGQYYLTEQHALDVGVEFLDHPWAVFYADYTFHLPRLFGSRTRFGRETSPYVGFGTGAGFWDRNDTCGRWNCTWTAGATGTGNGFFFRIPIGIDWFIRSTRIGGSLEFTPSYMWYPTNGQTYDLAVGGKYFF